MSLECQVDIFVDFIPEYIWLLFCQCKYLRFPLDTGQFCIDCILYLNLRQESQSQSDALKTNIITDKNNWMHC